ncbi:MAG: N-acetylmuramoyl-L-alanine amidase [Paludibacteraceae bacterium]|nr:N-acetylmuramoyl-L-alanine amidase [Paludibacteraceae bacterium]
MTKLRYILLLCALLILPSAQAAVTMESLGDSLTAYTGFSPLWSPPVKVKALRVNGNKVIVRTNATLGGISWTPQRVKELNRLVSRWVLGHDKGTITVISGRQSLEELITDYGKGVLKAGKQKDLTDKNIALWPSHGLYFNTARNEWIWQRATLWTTVEDLYSQEYVRLLRKMLENAGATIYMPRAGLENDELGLSGMPQWCEGARYWLQSQQVDSAIWDLYEGDQYKDDMKCRAMWVNSLDVPLELCLALHTDGNDSENDSTIIGTLCIYTAKDDDGQTTLRDGRNREKENRLLGDIIQTQLTNDLRYIAPEWTRRQLKEANYCESRVPVVPSVLVELLSHKNMADMRYGLDPAFRFTAMRSLYKGILRSINGKSAVVQPLPIEQVAFDLDGTIRWQPVLDSIEPTATPSYYLVYIQENDGEWNITQVDKTTHTHIDLKPNIQYNCYIVAGNDGGLSFPSPIVSAYRSPDTNAPTALVVDGFNEVYGPEWFADSINAGIVPSSYACENNFSCAYIGQQWNYSRASLWTDDDNCGWGACYRDHAGELTIGNTHDYAVQHGLALRRMYISYASCTPAFLSSFNSQLSTFNLIDYICGRNKTPLNAANQEILSQHVVAGGKLLISADHWVNTPAQWLQSTLHTSYYARQATHSGRITGPKHRVYNILLEPNENQLFTCTPEGLKPYGDSTEVMATYQDMRCPAAVGWQHATLIYGFPLETTLEFEKIYRQAVKWLLEQ